MCHQRWRGGSDDHKIDVSINAPLTTKVPNAQTS